MNISLAITGIATCVGMLTAGVQMDWNHEDDQTRQGGVSADLDVGQSGHSHRVDVRGGMTRAAPASSSDGGSDR